MSSVVFDREETQEQVQNPKDADFYNDNEDENNRKLQQDIGEDATAIFLERLRIENQIWEFYHAKSKHSHPWTFSNLQITSLRTGCELWSVSLKFVYIWTANISDPAFPARLSGHDLMSYFIG